MSRYGWDHPRVPKEATHIATDRNGDVYAYSGRHGDPAKGETMWGATDTVPTYLWSELSPVPDFRESLEAHP